MITNGQIMSWYHSKILRIPHGSQKPTKRYLTKEQILELFDGEVVVEEKVDGKLSCILIGLDNFWIYEDMYPKRTSVHEHIIKYTNVPKQVYLDKVLVNFDDSLEFLEMSYGSSLKYETILLKEPALEEIYSLLGAFSNLKSHFGSDEIEGLVIKNYDKQLMGKWINEKFEDKLDI